MSQTTPLLGLPYLDAAQAQKHVIHNEALRMLDAVVQLAVADRNLAAPPAEPANGDRYIVAAGASGGWAGRVGQVAAWQDDAWTFFAPMPGWLAWVADESVLVAWDGGGWAIAGGGGGGGGGGESSPLFGVNTTADGTNRLSVKSDAVLLSHDDVTPGSGDMRAVIDKADVPNTASLLFQTDSSGRAEFGLTGDDDFHVKVSADGAAWTEAMIVDKDTGRIVFPQGLEHAASRAPLSGLVFTPGGDGEVSILRLNRARSQNPRQFTLAGAAGDILTLTAADSDLIFLHSDMAGVSFVRIWNVSKTPAEPAWVVGAPGGDPGTTLQVTHAAHVAGWSPGDTIQLGDQAGFPGVPAGFTRGYALDISPLLQNRLGAVFRQRGIMFKCTVQGAGGRVALAASPMGVAGSFFGGNSLSDGGLNITMHMAPTTELSPISNSNLVYMREDDAGANTLGVCGVLLVGVWV